MLSDPIARLMRLRTAEADAARRDLAEALRALDDATGRVLSAKQAVTDEGLSASDDAAHPLAGAYAVWLPAGEAAVAAARAAEAVKAVSFEASRAALAGTRIALRACELVAETQAADRRAAGLKKAQIMLEDGGRGTRRSFV